MAKSRGRKPYSRRKYYKKTKPNFTRRSNRDFNNPQYIEWRNAVKERDGHMCQWPGCLSRKYIQVHHIKTWAKYPALRFTIANGITLCSKCHKNIKGKEVDYESFFLKLLEIQMLDKIRKYEKRRRPK